MGIVYCGILITSIKIAFNYVWEIVFKMLVALIDNS
jgi:hypothetical protein